MEPFPFAALLAATLVVMTVVAVATAPALAQVSGGNPPDYVLEEDGTVVIDGDVGTDCASFALALEQGYELAGNPERAQAVLEQCEEAGLLPSESTAPNASVPSEVSVVNGESGGLPETGGPALPALLVATVLVVVASGLLARKVAG